MAMVTNESLENMMMMMAQACESDSDSTAAPGTSDESECCSQTNRGEGLSRSAKRRRNFAQRKELAPLSAVQPTAAPSPAITKNVSPRAAAKPESGPFGEALAKGGAEVAQYVCRSEGNSSAAQRWLLTATAEEKELVAERLKGHMEEVVINMYGSFFFQALMKSGAPYFELVREVPAKTLAMHKAPSKCVVEDLLVLQPCPVLMRWFAEEVLSKLDEIVACPSGCNTIKLMLEQDPSRLARAPIQEWLAGLQSEKLAKLVLDKHASYVVEEAMAHYGGGLELAHKVNHLSLAEDRDLPKWAKKVQSKAAELAKQQE